MSKSRGLPEARKMRHDTHFVEEITSDRGDAIGRLLEIDRVLPNPHQPRKSFGDLSEMVASVKEKGILEPILVRAHSEQGKYEIIAGERRYQAAKLAGLRKVPCIEVDVDNRGMLEISLVENLQRKDLNPFEEAAALQRLSEQFRYTHEEIARKLGKSRTVITEALSLNRLPEEIVERCRQADIESKSMLLQIVRQESLDEMHRLVDRITGDGITREEARKFNRESSSGRPRRKQFTYRFKPEDDAFQVSLRFRRPEVDRHELIAALKSVLERLLEEEQEDAAGDSRKKPARPSSRGGNGRGAGADRLDWNNPSQP